jgi:GGDEF domain-containing protein
MLDSDAKDCSDEPSPAREAVDHHELGSLMQDRIQQMYTDARSEGNSEVPEAAKHNPDVLPAFLRTLLKLLSEIDPVESQQTGSEAALKLSLITDIITSLKPYAVDTGILQERKLTLPGNKEALTAPGVEILNRTGFVSYVFEQYSSLEEVQENCVFKLLDIKNFRGADSVIGKDGERGADYLINKIAANLNTSVVGINQILAEKGLKGRVVACRYGGDELGLAFLGIKDQALREEIYRVVTNPQNGIKSVKGYYRHTVDGEEVDGIENVDLKEQGESFEELAAPKEKHLAELFMKQLEIGLLLSKQQLLEVDPGDIIERRRESRDRSALAQFFRYRIDYPEFHDVCSKIIDLQGLYAREIDTRINAQKLLVRAGKVSLPSPTPTLANLSVDGTTAVSPDGTPLLGSQLRTAVHGRLSDDEEYLEKQRQRESEQLFVEFNKYVEDIVFDRLLGDKVTTIYDLATQLGKGDVERVHVIDLKGIKEINDRLSIAAGDKAIHELWAKIYECMIGKDDYQRNQVMFVRRGSTFFVIERKGCTIEPERRQTLASLQFIEINEGGVPYRFEVANHTAKPKFEDMKSTHIREFFDEMLDGVENDWFDKVVNGMLDEKRQYKEQLRQIYANLGDTISEPELEFQAIGIYERFGFLDSQPEKRFHWLSDVHNFRTEFFFGKRSIERLTKAANRIHALKLRATKFQNKILLDELTDLEHVFFQRLQAVETGEYLAGRVYGAIDNAELPADQPQNPEAVTLVRRGVRRKTTRNYRFSPPTLLSSEDQPLSAAENLSRGNRRRQFPIRLS